MPSGPRMHYVPRMLLRHFTNNDGMLWIYDKRRRNWFSSPVTKVGIEKNIYTEEVDLWLDREIESPTGTIFKNIRDGKTQLSKSDMETVANFISAQMVRVPAARGVVSEIDDPNSLNDSMQEIVNDLYILERESDLSISSSERKELQRLLCMAKSDPDLFLSEMEQETDPITLALDFMRGEHSQIADFLMRLAWRVIYADRRRFILSDNPVAMWNLNNTIEGANDFRFECVLPISMNCALHIGRYGQGGTINEIIKNDKIVKKLNVRTITRAHRFIYTSRKEKWISDRSHRKSRNMPHFRFAGPLIPARNDRPPCPHCGEEFTQEEWDSSEINKTVITEDGDYVLVGNRTIQHLCMERDK